MALPQANQQQLFFSIYFMMTGLHAAPHDHGHRHHARRSWGWRIAAGSTAEYHTPVEISGLYWHFVDIVWIFLFPLLYLLGAHHGAGH